MFFYFIIYKYLHYTQQNYPSANPKTGLFISSKFKTCFAKPGNQSIASLYTSLVNLNTGETSGHHSLVSIIIAKKSSKIRSLLLSGYTRLLLVSFSPKGKLLVVHIPLPTLSSDSVPSCFLATEEEVSGPPFSGGLAKSSKLFSFTIPRMISRL